MLVVIDPAAATPVFAQIAASITAQIASGELPTGTRLPAARELAATLGINVHTVLHAYQVLRDDGGVELRRGRGAVVVGGEAAEPVREALATAASQARAAGIPLGTLFALLRTEYES